MSGETRGKAPRPNVKGELCGSSRATPDKLYKEAKPVRLRKAKVPVRLAWRAFVPAYPRRSRDLAHPPFLAVSGALPLIYSDDATVILLTTKDLFQTSG